MGFPAGVQTVVLTGHVGIADGQAKRDTITFTPSPVEVVSATANFILDHGAVTVIPDRATGLFSVKLLATDATGFAPTGWTYTVARGTRTPYSIALPAAVPTVDLADLTPVSANPGVYQQLIDASTLGNAATKNVGTTANTVAAGDDSRFGNSSPWQFNIEDFGAVPDMKVVADGAVTGGVATLTCAASAPFTGAHVGKSVLIKGAGAAGVTSFRTTISAYTSASAVTLAAAPPTTVTGAIVIFGTNSYTAIRVATAAAEAYLNGTGTGVASTPHTFARVYTPPRPYIVDGPLDTSKSGNGQVPFGVYPTTDVKKIIEFSGETDGAAAVRHWEQLLPQVAGSCWISFGFYASTSAQITDLNANGNPGIISGPNEGTSNGLAYGASGRYSNVMVIIRNMALLNAHTAFGITYGMANLFGCANAFVENVGGGTLGTVASPSTDYTSPGVFGTGLSIGLLLPANGNNDHNVVRNLSIGGGYTYGMFLTEHGLVDRVMVLYCWAGLCPVGTYAGSVGATHAMKVLQASIEACGRELYFIGAGSNGVTIFDCDQLQTESGSPTIDGNSLAALAAVVGRTKLTGLFTPSGVTIAQPSGIELVNGQVPRAITIQTVNYAAGPLDRTILMDTTAGNLTLNLPSADFSAVEYIAKNVGANTLTVAALTSPQQKIYDTASVNSISLAAGASARLQAKYNGVAWAWYRL